MNALIRGMEDLVDGLRQARNEREVSHELLDAISGNQPGYTSKIMAGMKKPGPVSLFPLLGALGKALQVVDDQEQINRVKGRWAKRKIVGGSAIHQKKIEDQAMLAFDAGTDLCERMKALAKRRKRENLVKGGKARMRKMNKRERQRLASHAARKRWAIAREAANYKDCKGQERVKAAQALADTVESIA